MLPHAHKALKTEIAAPTRHVDVKKVHASGILSPTSAMQAAGWLAVLLPTNQVQKGKGAWNAWLADWMAIWAAQPNDTFLGMCMMGLISRLARNDTQCRASCPLKSRALQHHFAAGSWP